MYFEYFKKNTELTNIIFTSTVTVYGNTKKLLIDENYKPKPMSVYDKHKLYCENLLLYYSRLYYKNKHFKTK